MLFNLVGHTMTESQIDELVKAVDADGDGAVSYNEFVDMIAREAQVRTFTRDAFVIYAKMFKLVCACVQEVQKAELEQYFKVFDSDGKGSVSAERLKRVLDELGEPTTLAEAQAMIKFADLNKDGVVTLDEFSIVFERLN